MPTHPQQSREREDEVRWIGDRTKLSVGVLSALAICASIFEAGWQLKGNIETFQREIAGHFQKIEASQGQVSAEVAATRAALAYKWTEAEMSTWSNALDRANRSVQRKDGELGLIIPDVSAIRAAHQ